LERSWNHGLAIRVPPLVVYQRLDVVRAVEADLVRHMAINRPIVEAIASAAEALKKSQKASRWQLEPGDTVALDGREGQV